MWFLTKLWFKISFYKSPISYKYGDKTISGASSQLQKSTISLKIKGPSSKSCGFSSSHVWMWELNHQESWVPRNRCFWNVVLEKTLESPLDCKRSNQSILKEISPEYSLEWLMLELKFQYLATWCEELAHWKRPWCWERLKAGGEGVKEDEMVGWHHWLDGPEFEQAPGVGDGQGSLACCSPWGHRVRHDWASELNLCLLGRSKPIGWWGGKNLVFGVK